MKKKEDVLLQDHFINNMKRGDLGWFPRNCDVSGGYSWHCRPDLSGVYEIVEQVILHPSGDVVGAPGMIIWKLKAKRAGKGEVLFELFPPAGTQPAESITISIDVNK